MKINFAIALMALSMSGVAFAGNTQSSTGGNPVSSSTPGTATSAQQQQQQQQAAATSTNAGNNQAITFTTPADTTSTTTATVNQTVNSTGNQTVKEVVSGGTSSSVSESLRNVPNVNAPALTSSNDTCMGSTSIGAGWLGIGISGGTTWTDSNCKMLKNSRELWNMGMRGAAMARMCMDKDNREALEETGFTCPEHTKKSDKK